MEYDDSKGCVVVEDGRMARDLVFMGNDKDKQRFESRIEYLEKMESGILRSDMVAKRFDGGRKEANKNAFKQRRKQMLFDAGIDTCEFGMMEWIKEKRILAIAQTIKDQGKKIPTKFMNKIYPNTLEAWVNFHMRCV
jgi:hypothetical protein